MTNLSFYGYLNAYEGFVLCVCAACEIFFVARSLTSFTSRECATCQTSLLHLDLCQY